jgi:hypothetical protein
MLPPMGARWRALLGGLTCAALLSAAPSAADEGQWMPDQIAELDQRRLQAMGLQLSADALYNAHDGGLMRAAINYGGCSASFVSSEGLIATNYHCAYGALQAQATPEKDYLANGFVAAERSDELQAKSRGSVQVLLRTTDVSADVMSVAAKAEDDSSRYDAVERKKKAIVARCEQSQPGHRCYLRAFYSNSMYRLYETIELRDVRIVYAPPAAIGEYGGDIDNWMWPRHTGDFALLRAYVGRDGKPAEYSEDNVPYRPSRFLRVSPNGVREGDFVALMGYPGSTNRYLPHSEVQRYVDQVLKGRVELYGEWLALLQAQAGRSAEVAIKVAAIKKSVANVEKNARGMLEGIALMDLVARRQQQDDALRTAARSSERYSKLFAQLDELSRSRREAHQRDFLLRAMRRGSSLLPLAVDLVRRARERTKPDMRRESAYMDRNQAKLYKGLQRRLRNFDAEVEAHLLTSLVDRAQELELRISAFDLLKQTAGSSGQPVLDYVRQRVQASKLDDEKLVKTLFDKARVDELEALEDPLMDLALGLVPTIEASVAEAHTREGAAARLGPAYFELLKRHKSGPLYPDANGTLRFSYASVAGYSPRDGLWATPRTTLGGQVAKHTGVEPFDLPKRVRDAAAEGPYSYWTDPGTGDVPVCFLTNADTTGGNSGSPVVNGKGELVGLNFDRVWENIAGDFGYNTLRSRNVVVDIRYLLWLLDRVENAGALLDEMGLKSYRDMPPRSRYEAPARAPARGPIGCDVAGSSPRAAAPWWTLLSLAAALALASRLRANRRGT